jgi:hypothetical protein
VDLPTRTDCVLLKTLSHLLTPVVIYYIAMEFFDNVVIAVATLMEPILASFIGGYTCNIGFLPGPPIWAGWLGNILIACGTLLWVWYIPPLETEN